jgi:hypothetical protein
MATTKTNKQRKERAVEKLPSRQQFGEMGGEKTMWTPLPTRWPFRWCRRQRQLLFFSFFFLKREH